MFVAQTFRKKFFCFNYLIQFIYLFIFRYLFFCIIKEFQHLFFNILWYKKFYVTNNCKTQKHNKVQEILKRTKNIYIDTELVLPLYKCASLFSNKNLGKKSCALYRQNMVNRNVFCRHFQIIQVKITQPPLFTYNTFLFVIPENPAVPKVMQNLLISLKRSIYGNFKYSNIASIIQHSSTNIRFNHLDLLIFDLFGPQKQ